MKTYLISGAIVGIIVGIVIGFYLPHSTPIVAGAGSPAGTQNTTRAECGGTSNIAASTTLVACFNPGPDKYISQWTEYLPATGAIATITGGVSTQPSGITATATTLFVNAINPAPTFAATNTISTSSLRFVPAGSYYVFMSTTTDATATGATFYADWYNL